MNSDNCHCLISFPLVVAFNVSLIYNCLCIYSLCLCFDSCVQRKYTEQVSLNDQLIGEISELTQEARLLQEIPRRLCESVASCKDLYEDVLFTMQVNLVPYIYISLKFYL